MMTRQATSNSFKKWPLTLALMCVTHLHAARGRRTYYPPYRPTTTTTEAPSTTPKTFSPEAFALLKCKGTYDSAVYARLDRLCEDCYGHWDELRLKNRCSDKCYSTEYFPACLEAELELDDQKVWMERVVSLSGRGFPWLTTTAAPTTTTDATKALIERNSRVNRPSQFVGSVVEERLFKGIDVDFVYKKDYSPSKDVF